MTLGVGRRASLHFVLAALLLPAAGRAQEAGRRYRLAFITSVPRGPQHAGMFEELRRAGFVEGQNLVIDGFGATIDGLPAVAAEIVKARPDATFAGGDAAIVATLRTTRTIPIVAISDDLLGNGFVASLAQPGANLTGVSILATELNGKRQEILLDLIPGMTRVAALSDPATTSPDRIRALKDAAQARGVTLSVVDVATPAGISHAIDAAQAGGAQALNVLASSLFHANRGELMARVAAARLPAMFQWPEYVEEGGLIGYGPRLDGIYSTLIARQLIKVLRGTRPPEIPVEQPTNFELGINLQTAKKLGLAVPDLLVARADEVVR